MKHFPSPRLIITPRSRHDFAELAKNYDCLAAVSSDVPAMRSYWACSLRDPVTSVELRDLIDAIPA